MMTVVMPQNDPNRRDFFKMAVAGVFMMGGCAQRKGDGIDAGRLDRFGGLQDLRFEATGYFRAEKSDRWWFVTPEGSAFLSFGLNHTDKEYLLQDYNIDFWRSRFGFTDPAEPAFREGFIDKVKTDLQSFGMNSIGTHARKEFLEGIALPYVQGLFFVPTSYWLSPKPEAFFDVFSEIFRERCERIVAQLVMPRMDDPYLMGYTFTDCPILTDSDADTRGEKPWGIPTPPWGLPSQPNMPTWPRVLRNLGPDAPGKRVFVDLIRSSYSSIEVFNPVYGTRFRSFEALLEAREWSPVVKSAEIDDEDDNREFLLKILDQYYRVAYETIREVDPYHMIFGDIMNANTGSSDDVVSLVANHVDIVAYQFYGGYDDQRAVMDRWSRLAGKPLYHADSCFCVPYGNMPTPAGVICPDQETRARRFFDFASRAFSRPDFIGWSWCGWVDMWMDWRERRQHSGLQDPFGRYHYPMAETMVCFGSRLYEYGLGQIRPGKMRCKT